MPITLPAHLSYSALSTYAECGEKYRLTRGYHKDKATWYSTIAGSAIHAITEVLDFNRDFGGDKPVPTFAEVFTELLRKEAERGVEVKPSGKFLKEMGKSGGPNKKDREWWLHYGPEYVERWIAWRDERPDWQLAVMPDGQPGIEVEFYADLGGVPVKGFIDRVFIDTSTGQLVVLDLKNGEEPHSKLQLGTYSVAMYKQFGLRPEWGGYWMGKDGQIAGHLTDLTMYSEEYIVEMFGQARRGIEAAVFLPNVTSLCKGCTVRDYCRAVGGTQAEEIPVSDVVQITQPRVDSQNINV